MNRDTVIFAGRNTALALSALYDVYVKNANRCCDLRISVEMAADLHRAGILFNKRGRGGGAFLPARFDELTLFDLCQAVETEMVSDHPAIQCLDVAFRRVLRRTKVVDLFPEIAPD